MQSRSESGLSSGLSQQGDLSFSITFTCVSEENKQTNIKTTVFLKFSSATLRQIKLASEFLKETANFFPYLNICHDWQLVKKALFFKATLIILIRIQRIVSGIVNEVFSAHILVLLHASWALLGVEFGILTLWDA